MQKPRALYKGPVVRESDIERTVTEFMEWDGWRSFKMEAISELGFIRRAMAKLASYQQFHPFLDLVGKVLKSCMRAQGVGENGMPDRLFIRYQFNNDGLLQYERTYAEVLWIEFKRRGARPRPQQLAWLTAERARGALVRVVDDIDTFRAWYADSGLKRR